MTDFIESSHFDTTGLQGEDKFLAWKDTIDVVFDVNPRDTAFETSFGAKVDSYLLDDIAINRCHLGAQTFDRSAYRIAQDSLDHYQVHLFIQGGVDMVCGRRDVSAKSGQWVVLDLGEMFKSATTKYEIINIFIPRRRLAPLLRYQDGVHGLVFDSESGAARLLRDYIFSLNSAVHQMTLDQAPAAADVLTQLAAMALNGGVIDESDPPTIADHALLLNAQTFIKQNLGRQDLTPDLIAYLCNLSRSRLYRIFKPIGGVADYIREMRLRTAFTKLISHNYRHLSVASIAYDLGFSDPSHFSRLFKARFQATPTDVRASRTDAIANRSAQTDLPVGDTKYAFWIANLT